MNDQQKMQTKEGVDRIFKEPGIQYDRFLVPLIDADKQKAIGDLVRESLVMLAEISRHARRSDSFAFETTLSGRRYARQIPQWRAAGYRIKLYFLRLDSPEMAISRVRQRVALGGHAVADAVVRRRYESGWRNFTGVYRPLVDEWALLRQRGLQTATARRRS